MCVCIYMRKLETTYKLLVIGVPCASMFICKAKKLPHLYAGRCWSIQECPKCTFTFARYVA